MKNSSLIIPAILAGSLLIVGDAAACKRGWFNSTDCHNNSSYGRSDPRRCGDGDKIMRMIDRLDLSKQQETKVLDIVDQQRSAQRERTSAMRDGRKELHEAITGGDYDPAKIKQLADAQGKLKADMIMQRIETMSQVFNLLNEEQKAELEKMRERRWGRF